MISLIRLFLFSLLLVISGTATAQSNFRPGYILPLTGDTLRGEVQYRSDILNARQCVFRPSAQASAQTYTPQMLRSFGFTQLRHYQSWPISTTDTTNTADYYFLERLVAGPASLYYHRAANAKDRYYLVMQGDSQAVELVSRVDVVPRADNFGNVNRFSVEKPLYRTTLSKRFVDCPVVQLSVGSVLLTRSSLVEVVRRYNNCSGPATTDAPAVSISRPAHLSLGVVGGAEASRLTFSSATLLDRGEYQSGPVPVGGIFMMLSLPANNERLALRLEALAERQRYQSEFTDVVGGTKLNYQARIDFLTLRVPLMMRLTFATKGIKPYLEAGFSVANGLRRTFETRRTGFNSTAYGPWETADPAMRKYQLGVVAGGGLRIQGPFARPLELAIRGEADNGFTRTNSSTTTRLFLLLGYSLTPQSVR